MGKLGPPSTERPLPSPTAHISFQRQGERAPGEQQGNTSDELGGLWGEGDKASQILMHPHSQARDALVLVNQSAAKGLLECPEGPWQPRTSLSSSF